MACDAAVFGLHLRAAVAPTAETGHKLPDLQACAAEDARTQELESNVVPKQASAHAARR
jgi:hypothetical protein